MRTVNTKKGCVIPIGRLGENEATAVVFDVGEWLALFGEGNFSLLAQRNSDAIPYPCVVERDGNLLTWNVKDADVSVVGYGKCELIYTVGDTVAKSEIYTTVVGSALTGGGEVPEPYEDWVQRVVQAGASAIASAETASEKAQTATNAAMLANRNAFEAENSAQAATNAANSAKFSAQAANASKESASISAEQAAQSAENALESKNAASSSASAAVSAKNNAQLAEVSAQNAKEKAETAAENAEAAKEAAIEELGKTYTKEQIDAALEEKVDKADYSPVAKTETMIQAVGKATDGTLWTEPSGGAGTSDHTRLTNRDSANQHPISAITGLDDALGEIHNDIALKANDADVYHEWQLAYDGTKITKDSVEQNFTQIANAVDDKTKFVYIIFQNRLYIPQYRDSSLVSFSCSYLDGTTPTIRRIRMNSAGTITTATETSYTKTETDTKLSGKQDTIADLDTIRTGAENGTVALGAVRAKEYKTILDTTLTAPVETVLQTSDVPVTKCRITVFLKDGKVYTRRWYSTRSGAQNPPYLGCLTLPNTEVVVFESEIFKDYILDTMNMYSINTAGSAYTTDKWSDVFKVYNTATASMKSNMMFGASAGAGNKFPIGTRIIVEVITV